MKLWWKIREFFISIGLFFERGKKGYTHQDWWSLRDWICDTLGPQLIYWADHANSYPDDIPEIKGPEQWSDFLRDSGKALIRYEEITQSDECPISINDPLYKELEDCRKKIEKFFKVFGKNFHTFWD